MIRRVAIAALLIGVAYGVGWMSQAALGDDPCLPAGVRETDRYDYVDRWLPPRTDCRVTTSSGDTKTASGSSEVFLVMFTLTLVVIAALISGASVAARASMILATGAAAFLVIFVL